MIMVSKDTIESGFAGYHYRKNSGLIRCYRYSWKQNVVEIGFDNGKLFWYSDVPDSAYSSFSMSDDPDIFFKKYGKQI